MIYIRGNKQDYDAWEEQGCKGWSYAEVLPYFKRAEKQTGQIEQAEYHGFDGPLVVEDCRYNNELTQAFLKATEELGYQQNKDFNGESQLGFGKYQVTKSIRIGWFLLYQL
eukprot:TRINITY_DN16277_c0_g1_i9.p2 TRINITY_DN16277_c0_g1~~TRINITY_DN16277_c0_g1_i9.p2  ORF type:complete len:111 (-),score=14.21 TRINITY_DN16277_c0_g1_i9:107-439(-)